MLQYWSVQRLKEELSVTKNQILNAGRDLYAGEGSRRFK
jgi:hypothetical protein